MPTSHSLQRITVVRIDIPERLDLETIEPNQLPGWDEEDMTVSRRYGDGWIRAQRTTILRVPSVITNGHEYNLLLNTAHLALKRIRPGEPEPVHWDARLFHRPSRP